jgi:hypothetical protein
MMQPNLANTGLAGWPRNKGSFAITVILIGPACDRRPSNAQSQRKRERFDAGDYEATDESVSDMELPLTGTTVRAICDNGLMAAMQHHRLSISEEALAASPLKDLAPGQ